MEITKILSQTAIDYKKNIAGKFMLVEGANARIRKVLKETRDS